MKDEILNTQDMIDSRDIIARIEELQDMRDDLESTLEELRERLKAITDDEADEIIDIKAQIESAEEELSEWEESEEGDEFKALKALEDDASSSSDWKYGETLIRDSYFREYAEQLADDIGYMNNEKSNQWPYTCIDWEKAARELQEDYMCVDFDGVKYWIRS